MKKLHFIQNQRGYSVLIAIFSIVFISILALSLFTVTSNSMQISKSEHDDQATYYVAEAGLAQALQIVKEVSSNAYTSFESSYNNILSSKLGESSKQKAIAQLKEDYYNNIQAELTSKISDLTTNPTYSFDKANSSFDLKLIAGSNTSYTFTSEGKIDNHTRKIQQSLTLNDPTSNYSSSGLPPINIVDDSNDGFTVDFKNRVIKYNGGYGSNKNTNFDDVLKNVFKKALSNPNLPQETKNLISSYLNDTNLLKQEISKWTFNPVSLHMKGKADFSFSGNVHFESNFQMSGSGSKLFIGGVLSSVNGNRIHLNNNKSEYSVGNLCAPNTTIKINNISSNNNNYFIKHKETGQGTLNIMGIDSPNCSSGSMNPQPNPDIDTIITNRPDQLVKHENPYEVN